MKKNFLWMMATILTCGLTATMLTACNNDDDDNTGINNLDETIKGKWMMAEADGKLVPTDSKQVVTYESASKYYYSLSISAISDLNLWVNRCEGQYTNNGNKLSHTVEVPNTTPHISFAQQFEVLSINDDEMQLIANNKTFKDGELYRNTKDLKERKVRVTKDYSKDIIGTWEGQQTSDKDTHSDGKPHRWEYKADGTFVYYSQNDKGEWVNRENTMAEYFVDGILLCSRWKNVGDDTEKRESWEIASIKDGKMEWTALRQAADGSYYTATFSMTQVK